MCYFLYKKGFSVKFVLAVHGLYVSPCTTPFLSFTDIKKGDSIPIDILRWPIAYLSTGWNICKGIICHLSLITDDCLWMERMKVLWILVTCFSLFYLSNYEDLVVQNLKKMLVWQSHFIEWIEKKRAIFEGLKYML
jgi:hypothetical protein